MATVTLCLLTVSAPLAAAAGQLDVLYAGSLSDLMERGIGPAFERATGDRFRGYAGGSQLLANEIKGRLRAADVFISADPRVDRSLMGKGNGDWIRWYIGFAQSPLVVGYNPRSAFAAEFGEKPWYEVLSRPGLRLGRTDPKLDPKGARTLELMQRAAAFYRLPGLAERVLGQPDNPRQIFPEEVLIGRLQSGQLDAGFFYASEAADAKIPTVTVPPAIAPSAAYTVAIPRGARSPPAAEAFLAFLLGPQGRDLLKRHGLDPVPPVLAGDAAAAPPAVRALVAKKD